MPLKLPEPVEVQVILPGLLIVADILIGFVGLAQTTESAIGSIVGFLSIVKIVSLVTCVVHGVFPFAVSVRVTVPLAMSVVPGVYIGLRAPVIGSAAVFVNTPSPVELQTKSFVFPSTVAVVGL